MKYKISKNMYLIASGFIALVAIYIGFVILRRTHEGLSDGASTTNDEIVQKTTFINTSTTSVLSDLNGNPTSYINLLKSYKNNKIATAIHSTVINKNNAAFANIAEYDEAIDYLKTLGVSDTATNDPSLDAIISSNNTSTSDILFKLSADNQAYIDLLTSYKNNKMATGVLDLVNTKTIPILTISEVEPTIGYLRNIAGITLPTKPYEPTTRNISLSSN